MTSRILLFCDGVELSFDGHDAKQYQGTKKGKIYLTTHRMIFINHQLRDPLQSFSTPFMNITSVELEQPVFGANYIKGKVKAQEGGNWTGSASFKLKFMKGGAIEFGQAMLQAAKMASRYMPPQPPPYSPYPNQYFPAAPPVYTPPPQGYQGFVIPTQVFPDQPPANTVYMYNAPPPYPGISSPPMYGPPNGGMTTNAGGFTQPGQDAKSMEAAQSAYYNPYNPGNAYVPAPPPPYNPASAPAYVMDTKFIDQIHNLEISTKTKTSSIKEKFWNFKKANWNLYQQNTNEDFRKAPTSIKDLEQNWISFKNTIIKAAKVSIPRGLTQTLFVYFVYSGCHKDTHKEYNSGTCLQTPVRGILGAVDVLL
ncbi:WBP2 [Cordylochernes scorpioides]|uniref:WBP2 n=1 Tax=Cordylochernes scorpioides TaxID=51811 RepID=A0ABY6LJF2_9ARAC|nr:WBP2 [Cordylochernes scorpioides]